MIDRIAAIIADCVERDISSDRIATEILEVMREPTEAMVDKGDGVRGNHVSGYDNSTAGIWRSMVDEALK